MASRDDVRRALIQRVARKVSGHGIARRFVEGAVDRVLAALPGDAAGHRGTPDAMPLSEPSIVAVLASPWALDLASRARRALERAGQRVVATGTATAGRHTVVTVRVPAGAEDALERVARELPASLTVLDATAASQVSA